MRTRWPWMLCAASVLACAGLGVKVLADGAPEEQPLFYAGTLEIEGTLASGEHTVSLELYASETGGDELCAVEQTTEVNAGRFRIDASECADALRDEPDAWVAVGFRGGDGIERTISGRTKIGAAPYALEADHAKVASSARGELAEELTAMAERIDALETTVGETRSAFQAIKTVQTPLTVGPTVLDFDDEVFDQRDEYEPATGVFTARTAGRYQFFCTIGWHVDTHDRIGQYEAALRVNGDELTYNGHTSDGFFATRQVSAVFELEEGDEVQCASFQDLPDLTLNLASRFTRFEGGAF